MVPSPTTTFTSSEEKEVRLLLRERNPRSLRKAEASLYAMPASASADLLAKIAGSAARVSQARRKALLTAVASFGVVAAGASLLHHPAVPVAGAVLAVNLVVAGLYDGIGTGRRAALLLAERDDYRAIAPLARLWEVAPAKRSVAASDNDTVEHTLTRLLTALTAHKYENVADDAMRDLLGRAFPPPTRSGKLVVLADLSDARADLLLAALRYLSHATPGEASVQTWELVARIAGYPVPDSTPNRSIVHETAALCLDPAHRATPLAAAAPVAQTARV